jgi:hypothetical protein
MKWFASVGSVGLVVCALVLSGCVSGPEMVDIHFQDNQASKAAARLEVFPAGFAKSRKAMGGVELGYEQIRGSSSQGLNALEYIKLNGARIDGPQEIAVTGKVHQGHVAYVHRFSFGRNFELTPRVGLAAQQVSLTATPSTLGSTAAKRDRSLNLMVGVTPRFLFNPMLAAETRLTASASSDRTLVDAELAMLWQPVPELSVRAGLFWRRQKIERQNDSDLSLKMTGPMVSVGMAF